MITRKDLSTLKIHKLSQKQYDRELAEGRIEEDALYLTPDNGGAGYGSSIRYDERQELTETQRTQARHNIGAAELNDIYKNGLQEFYYTWDGTTDGRDVIAVAKPGDSGEYAYFYKVSDEIPNRNLIRNFNEAIITYNNGYTDVRNEGGENNQIWTNHYFYERDGWYAIVDIVVDLSIIFIENAGSYSFYNSGEYSFNAQSPGVYFPCVLSNDETDARYITILELTASYKHGIYLSFDDKKYTVELTESGALKTVDPIGNTIWNGSKINTSNGSGSGLPEVTIEHNDNILQVVNGEWTVTSLENSTIASYIDEYIAAALRGEY